MLWDWQRADPVKGSSLRKQDRLDVHRAVQDMQDDDPALCNAIENQIPAMNPATNVMVLIAWDDWPGFRHVSQFEATTGQFLHET